jgi:hypothetical protein
MMDGLFGILDGWKEDEFNQGNLGYGGYEVQQTAQIY